MTVIHTRSIALMSVAGVGLLAFAIFFPLAKSAWNETQAQRAEAKEFVSATEADQQAIVRALLTREQQKSPPCDPAGHCPEPIYFDRLSAVLRSIDSSEPWRKYEVRTLRPNDALIDRASISLPIPLQELLDQLVQQQFSNADPSLPGVTFVPDLSSRPLPACSKSRVPRLIRISRAAKQQSDGVAIALVTRTWCDDSTGVSVAKFRRDIRGWTLVEDYLGGP